MKFSEDSHYFYYIYILIKTHCYYMNIKLSDELNLIVSYAREEAMRTGSYAIGNDHLYLGIIRHSDNIAAEILRQLGIDLAEMKKYIDYRIYTNENIPYSALESINLSRSAQNLLSITMLEAIHRSAPEVSSLHLLITLSKAVAGYANVFLKEHGIDSIRIRQYVTEHNLHPKRKENDPSNLEDNGMEQPQEQEGSFQEQEISLTDFGYDLTQAATEGKLDPVVGREQEINRIIEILGRRKKNNPMLVGEPGVGKSAIIEGIAIRIAKEKIPPVLKNKKIISLDIASVVAGTKYRGEFEQRIKKILKQVSKNPDIILFIDEFHTLVGAGSSQGGLDAANMFKPALARGDIQCIGATTLDEFSKIVEKDGALDRRFQKIIVNPTDIQETISILQKSKSRYEEFHSVVYSDGAIEACARLTDRYIPDRSLPDKAIDALDETGSMVRLRHQGEEEKAQVTEEDIATIVSKITGIPINRVAESEGQRILNMEKYLQQEVIGQNEAIKAITKAIMRNRAGIKDPGRPIGSFLFLGPTGVGKTHLAKCLARYLFDSDENLIRIDMSEYMEKFSVSRLIGAPPGYIGYDKGGQLSEKVRRSPYCVVLLDEIEKAHPDVFNILLQVLDEGRLTDSEGRHINFKNTIVIMTSNVGSKEIEEYGNGIGFATSRENLEKNRQNIVDKSIRKIFSPEFINRIDDKIYFKSLEKGDLEKIIDIELKDLKKRISNTGYRLQINPTAKNFLAETGYDPAFGARPLKRALMKYVEDPVSEFIINDRIRHPKKAGETETKLLKLCLAPDKLSTRIKIQ